MRSMSQGHSLMTGRKPEATRSSAVSGARKMLPDVVQRTAF